MSKAKTDAKRKREKPQEASTRSRFASRRAAVLILIQPRFLPEW